MAKVCRIPRRRVSERPMPDLCKIYLMGEIDYLESWVLQKSLIHLRGEKLISDTLLLLEHPHVFTVGRRGNRSDILGTDGTGPNGGVPIYEVDRGGETTYHGPGQLIGYPIFALKELMGPVKYVRTLENALIEALLQFEVKAHKIPGQTGVWVTNDSSRMRKKIAAIGVRFSRGVTSHGFALKVNTNLGYFQHIVACGIENLEVTSVNEQIGSEVEIGIVQKTVANALCNHFNLEPSWADAIQLKHLLTGSLRQGGPLS